MFNVPECEQQGSVVSGPLGDDELGFDSAATKRPILKYVLILATNSKLYHYKADLIDHVAMGSSREL
jgi:hypothetical protein